MSSLLKNLAVAFCAVVLLSGCSSKGKHASNALISEFENTVGDRVYFDFNSANLSAEAKTTLEKQAAWLKEHKGMSVTVEGHCDERGTVEYNIALGEKRAHAVRSFLESNGLKGENLETISYGKERPAVVGNDEAAYAKNRRGVTVLK